MKKFALDLKAASTADDLAGFYGALRADGSPVVSAEKIGDCEFRAVIGYQAVRAAAADPGTLSSEAEGITIPAVTLPAPALPVELDPPGHRKYRRLLVPELRPDRIADWSEMIRRETDRVLDEFTEAGEGDLAAIARHVPSVIIAAVLGVPDDGPFMVDITSRIIHAATGEDTEAHAAANADLAAYLDRIVSDAEGGGRTDLLATIANAEIDGEPIGHDMAVATVLTLVVAGQDTTIHGIGSMLALIGARPDIKRALIEDPSLIPAAVEESLRMEAPVQALGRTVLAGTELAGCPVRTGERLALAWGAANLDPAEFENPGEFRLDRENAARHLTFGHGIHRCVGEHLARAELTIVAERVLARIPDYQLAAAPRRGPISPMNRGVSGLPVTFTPSPRLTRAAEGSP